MNRGSVSRIETILCRPYVNSCRDLGSRIRIRTLRTNPEACVYRSTSQRETPSSPPLNPPSGILIQPQPPRNHQSITTSTCPLHLHNQCHSQYPHPLSPPSRFSLAHGHDRDQRLHQPIVRHIPRPPAVQFTVLLHEKCSTCSHLSLEVPRYFRECR